VSQRRSAGPESLLISPNNLSVKGGNAPNSFKTNGRNYKYVGKYSSRMSETSPRRSPDSSADRSSPVHVILETKRKNSINDRVLPIVPEEIKHSGNEQLAELLAVVQRYRRRKIL
jgi:hypothetical protein